MALSGFAGACGGPDAACVKNPQSFDCWSCPVTVKQIRIMEFLYRKNRLAAERLKRYIRKYMELLKERYGRDYKVKIMNFCGTHEWSIVHFGIRHVVGKDIELIAGPGCPVCVTPSYYIEQAIKLALEGVRVYTYGDAFKLPALRGVKGARSLQDAKAMGGDVKVVHSIVQAAADARRHGRDSVFFGIGFETIAPGYAEAIVSGLLPENLKFMSLVKLTPPAMRYSLDVMRKVEGDERPIQGIIAPGHVSTIVGAKAWTFAAEEYGVPVVVSGFEANDVLLSIAEILRQLVKGEARVVIEYTRAVTWEGDLKAQRVMAEAFEEADTAWRGIGFIPKSGLVLSGKYREKYDALEYFGIPDLTPETWRYDLPARCRCAEITIGLARPTDCPLFMKACTPDRPIGPCMASMEGACAVWARFGGAGLASEIARDAGVA